jgi:hypothetical protein
MGGNLSPAFIRAAYAAMVVLFMEARHWMHGVRLVLRAGAMPLDVVQNALQIEQAYASYPSPFPNAA